MPSSRARSDDVHGSNGGAADPLQLATSLASVLNTRAPLPCVVTRAQLRCVVVIDLR